MSVKILCVEDDINLGNLLKATLVKNNYQVDLAEDGQIGWELAENSAYNLIILDLLLPKIDGIELCKRLRFEKSADIAYNRYTPVILMTSLEAVTKKIAGLDAGADDYIVKPFDLEELLARIRALLRRNQNRLSQLLRWGELCLNPNSCEVSYSEQPIHLSKKEYEILEMFLRNPQQILSPNLFLERLWTTEEMPTQGALRAHIKGLRNKLGEAGANELFETVYKLGYRLKPPTIINKSTIKVNKKQLKQTIIQTKSPPDFISATDGVLPELKELWQQSCQSYQERLLSIQKAVISLQQGRLTPEQHHEAEREAHTLIGSLGSFGLNRASEVCRQIQQILQQEQLIETIQVEELSLLVAQLQQYMELDNSTKSSLATSVFQRLLIIDNNIVLAKKIAEEATTWGFTTEIVINSAQAEQILANATIDVILLDLHYQNNVDLALDFLTKLRRQHSEIPVVIVSQEDSLMTRLKVARLGIPCFLQKQMTTSQILASLTQVLQNQHLSLYRLLVVDDDPGILQLIAQLLSPDGYQITLLEQPEKFWETLEQTNPDLVILDVELFTLEKTNDTHKLLVNGFDLCQMIRSDWRWNRLPILFLSSHTDVETIQHSFAVGANDFLNKPIVAKELQTRVRTRLEQQQIWKSTEVDALTRVSLRGKAIEDLNRLLQQATRQQQPLSLAVLDLDLFKSINDKYGHLAGDRVLNYLGQLLNQCFRSEDVVGRWGGEEFVVGMYGMTGQATQERLVEVLQKLQQYSFTTSEGVSFHVTFSAGIAQFPNNGEDVQTLFQAADIALYKAKQQGRNLIFLVAEDYTK